METVQPTKGNGRTSFGQMQSVDKQQLSGKAYQKIDDIGNFMGKGISFGTERHEVVQKKLVWSVCPEN